MRFGPNRISVNSETALRDVYGHQANVQKSKVYKVFSDFMHDVSTHTVIDKTQHGRKKRVLSQALSDRAMKAVEDHILELVRQFCGHLVDSNPRDAHDKASLNEWASAKNISRWCNYLSFDIMGRLTFGKSFHMMEREDNRYILKVLQDGSQGLQTVRFFYAGF